jgi:hypothetical protein
MTEIQNILFSKTFFKVCAVAANDSVDHFCRLPDPDQEELQPQAEEGGHEHLQQQQQQQRQQQQLQRQQ